MTATMKGFTKLTDCGIRTYDHFVETIKKAKNEGYEIAGFGQLANLKAAEKAIILRHDIDFSLKSAVRLAGLEDVIGVSATYFISMHREHYSPLLSETRKTIHAIIDHGHEIGLHYEPEFDDLQAEISLLEHYLDCKITAIARHNPFGNHIDIDSVSKPLRVVDAYAPDIMEYFKYLSDSSGIWREGCFCGHVGHSNKMQVLIHPEWWSSETVLPTNQLVEINLTWQKNMIEVGKKAIENLALHREKIEKGQA